MENEKYCKKVTHGITTFGTELLKNGVTNAKNGVVAVYSVASVLSMTLLGAAGNTAREIKGALLSHNSPHGSPYNSLRSSIKSNCSDMMDMEDEVDGSTISVEPDTNEIDMHSTHRTSRLNKVKNFIRRSSQDHFKLRDEDFHKVLAQTVRTTDNHDNKKVPYTLRNANRLYIKKSGALSKNYISTTDRIYGTKPESVSFSSNPEKCRHDINSWVEKQTENKIRELIPVGCIDGDTSIVIVNAIYFKGDWENKFDPMLTSPKPFNTASGEQVTADFMCQDDIFLYKSDDVYNVQVLELPYVNNDLSFVVILPSNTAEFMKLRDNLDATMIERLTTNMLEQDMILYLPKFKIDIALDISSVLQSVGINDLFIPGKANLTGIEPKGTLHVSGVIHQAFIEVNEEGCEAAGATAEIVRAAGAPSRRTIFKADHPFFFLIKDNRSQAVLFIGQYCEPNANK